MMLERSRSVVVVTGASRGIGREIAIQASSKIADGSTVVLVARTLDGLEETEQLIREASKGVNVEIIVADFLSFDIGYTQEIAEVVSRHVKNVELVAIFHVAGTIGDLKKRSEELNCVEDWHAYLQTNLVSTILTNNAVYSVVKDRSNEIGFLVVDITSLLAIKAFPSFTQYSIAKASREAFFRSFALENKEARVLSYSPGPVNTRMRVEIANDSYSEEIRAAFSSNDESDASRSVLTPKQTVLRLMEILASNNFESGTRIDYFDESD